MQCLVDGAAIRDLKHARSLCLCEVSLEQQLTIELVNLPVSLFAVGTIVGVNTAMADTHRC